MKKLLGLLSVFLLACNFAIASEYKNKVFGLIKPDSQLVCDHDETSEISAWNFTEIQDEILGDFVLVKPLGVLKDKDNKPVKNITTRGTITVVNNKLLPEGTKWVQLFYDNKTLSIKSIAMFGYLNETVSEDGFKLITTVYNFKSSDKDFLKNSSQAIKEARLNFPKDITKADDIDVRNHFIRILGITKIAGQKEFEMDYDMSYKRKKSEYLCQLFKINN